MKRILSVFIAVILTVSCISIATTVSAAEDFVLENFDSSFDATQMNPNTKTDYGMPIFSTTTDGTEDGEEGLKAEWGTKKNDGSYGEAWVHQMPVTADWSTITFAQKAEDYGYLRFWLSNPTHKELLVMTRLYTADTKVHFKAHRATVTLANGDVLTHTSDNAINDYGMGSYTTIHIPANFAGWIAYPLDSVTRTNPAGNNRPALSSFADVNTIEFDIRLKDKTTTQGYYYVLDNLTLTDSTGAIESTTTSTITPPSSQETTTPAKEEQTLVLENFTDVTDFSYMSPYEHSGYALPTMEATDTNTDEGSGMRVNWVSTNNAKAHVHTFIPEAEWANKTFAENADNYDYLRFWISNPTFIQLELTVRVHTADTKAYMNANSAIVSRKDGTKITHVSGNATNTGTNSSISIPSSFSGWVAYPISTNCTSGATGRNNITSFADVTKIEVDLRRPETYDSDAYYILDEFCLSTTIIGNKKALGDDDFENNEGEKIESDIKNVIVLVGDGMGQTILQATRDHLGKDLYMDGMEYISKEICSDNVYNQLTDSAAAGTALSCGVRTNNGYVAIDKNGKPVENMVEFFNRADKKTGLVTTSYLLDATPATYGGRATNRGNYTGIAQTMFDNNISVLLGGGTDEMAATVSYGGQVYTLTEYAQEAYGYKYVTTKDALNAATDEKVLGLFAPHYMDYEQDRSSQPSIEEMTEKAISLLDNDEEGFFLMVEGGNIDHAAHANDFSRTITDTVAFDKAIKVALDFMNENPDTLVVVCADHSTGGLQGSNSNYYFTTNNHDQSLTAVFASGKGSEHFTGLKENSDVCKAIHKAVYGFENPYITDGDYISGFTNNSIATIKANYESIDNCTVKFIENKQEVTSGVIKTGMTVEIYLSGTLYKSYTAIIYGDVNGDGLTNSADLLCTKKHILSVNILNGAALKAMAVCKNDSVSSADLLLMKRHIVGLAEILQK